MRAFTKLGFSIILPVAVLLVAVLLLRTPLSGAVTKMQTSSDEVGDMGGGGSVTLSGNLQYTVPIAIPPGINGAEPSLSLIYNSGDGNGALGVGWSLSGSSAITRCSALPAIDGRHGAIDYNKGDRYCLDGQRLVNQQGTYGAPGSEYRTEIESWQRVVASSNSCGSGPCEFTVTAKDGSILSYGSTVASPRSRTLAQGLPDVRVWRISRATDPNGNTITYLYTSPVNGESYIDRIDYGANQAAGVTAANRSVRFSYAARPDQIMSYSGGAAYTQASRLTNVKTYLDEELVQDYRLQYVSSVATGRSLLQTVKICTAAGTCLGPTTLDWQGQKIAFRSQADLSGKIKLNPNFQQVIPADVDGSGKGDLLLVGSEGSLTTVLPLLSDGTALRACPTTLAIAGKVVEPLDLNGDGKIDLVVPAPDNLSLKLDIYMGGNGKDSCGFTTERVPVDTKGSPDVKFFWPMDINGDGKTDLLLGRGSGRALTVTVLISTGTTFRLDPASELLLPFGVDDQINALDANGDGMVDLVKLAPIVKFDGARKIEITTYLSTGDALQEARSASEIDARLTPAPVGVWSMDLNDDGLTDLVIGNRGDQGNLLLQPILAKGKGQFIATAPTQTGNNMSTTLQIWPMDANGDGMIDLVQAMRSNGLVQLAIYQSALAGTGKLDAGITVDTKLSAQRSGNTWPVDYTGDGKTDLVQLWADPERAHVDGLRNEGPAPDLAERIQNSIGGAIAAKYRPMSDPSVYLPGDSSEVPDTGPALTYSYRQAPSLAPYQRVSGGVQQLVSRLVASNDPEVNQSTYSYAQTFQYQGGLIDFTGRGWLGFASVTKTDADLGRVQTTQLNQFFPLTGTISGMVYSCDASAGKDSRCTTGRMTLTASETSYACPVAGSTESGGGQACQPVPAVAPGAGSSTKSYSIRKSKVVFNTFDYGQPDFSRARSYRYDDYDNLTRVEDLGLTTPEGTDLSPNDNVYTCSRYQNDVAGWAFGYLTDGKLSQTAVTCENFSDTAFDSAVDYSLGHVVYDDKFNPTVVSIYDDSVAPGRVLSEGRVYDGFGNLTQHTPPGLGATQYQIEARYHTYVDTVTLPPNQQNDTATMRLGFDPRFGTQVAAQSLNGQVFVSCVDDFGRLTATQTPLPGTPVNVTPSANCLSGPVTGPAATFTEATVVTVATASESLDANRHYLTEMLTLQDWPTGRERRVERRLRTYQDGLRRTYMATAQRGNAGEEVLSCANYNAANKVIRAALPDFAVDQACTSSSGSGFLWMTQSYDSYGRPLQNVLPLSADRMTITQLTYAPGLKVTIERGAGSNTSLKKILTAEYFNGKRRIVTMTMPQQDDATTHYRYDRIGRLQQVTEPRTVDNPNGVINTVSYDSLNRKRTLDNPDQNTTNDFSEAFLYTYGSNGMLEESRDAKGHRTHFNYDLRGRVTSKAFADGSVTRFVYDKPESNSIGLLSSESASGSDAYTTLYGYDALGNVVYRRLEYGGESYDTQAEYDPQSHTVRQTFPDRTELTRQYSYGRLAKLLLDDQPIVSYGDYTALDQPRRIDYANGAQGQLRYLASGLIESEKVEGAAIAVNGARGLLLDNALTWDTLLNLQKIQDQRADKVTAGDRDHSENYDYTIGRLTTASAPSLYATLNYEYSADGNMTHSEGRKLKYQAHRLVSIQEADDREFKLTYDPNGNLQDRAAPNGQWQYTYDVRNRLRRVDKDAAAVLEVESYTDSGQRLAKKLPDGTRILYPAPGYKVTKAPGETTRITKYLAGDNGLAASASAPGKNRAHDLLYFYANQVGSTTLTLTADGQLSSRLAYLPYGADFQLNDGGPQDVEPKFQGQEQDPTAGLYYFGARYYDADLGHFLTPDTQLGAGLYHSDSLNRFAFALNNPVTYQDPTGHNVWQSIAGFFVGAVETVAGVAVDVLSDGALEPVGNALIGGGRASMRYSVTHSKNFSWKQFGRADGTGATVGLALGAIGPENDPEIGSDAVEQNGVQQIQSDLDDADKISKGGDVEASSEGSGDTAGGSSESDDAGGSCQAGSFVAGTPVWTAEGLRPIEEVIPQQKVVSRNAVDGVDRVYPIQHTITHRVREVVELEISAADGRTETFRVTPAHPIALSDGRWVKAGDLKGSDRMATKTEIGARLLSKRSIGASNGITVHDLTLAPDHSYFVGDFGLWVHNMEPVAGPAGAPPEADPCQIAARTEAITATQEGRTWGSSAALQLPDGTIYTARSGNRELPDLLSRRVSAAKDYYSGFWGKPKVWMGKCAEINCYAEAMEAGRTQEEISRGRMFVVPNADPTGPRQNSCGVCWLVHYDFDQ